MISPYDPNGDPNYPQPGEPGYVPPQAQQPYAPATPPANPGGPADTQAAPTWNPNPAPFSGGGVTPTGAQGSGISPTDVVPGIDPRLSALYQKYNQTPGAKGSGLTDWQYWQNLAGTAGWGYVMGRLESDLAGNGPDSAGNSSGGSNGGGGSTGTTLSFTPATMASNPFLDQVRSQLMNLITADQQPIDPNSPQIAVPYNAAANVAQTSRDAEQKALAEQLYAQGQGSSSNELQQGIQQSYEREAQNLAGIKGDLISRVYQTQQQQLSQALGLAVQTGDTQSAQQLQMALANLQMGYQYAALGQNQGQWNDQYGLALQQLLYQQNLTAERAAAGLSF